MATFLQWNTSKFFNIFTGIGKESGSSSFIDKVSDSWNSSKQFAQNAINGAIDAVKSGQNITTSTFYNGTGNVAKSYQKAQVDTNLGKTKSKTVKSVYNTKYSEDYNKNQSKFKTDADSNTVAVNGKNVLMLPRWGVKDYLNERSTWVKGIESLTGGVGYSYFKIFFNFSNDSGLLGDIITDNTDNRKYFLNTAKGYLLSLEKSGRFSSESETGQMLWNKRLMLEKFVKLLSYINTNAPWFFESVDNLEDASKLNFDKAGEKHTIRLKFKSDAIDMRITTLFDLYKFACYDNVYFREIIPENLRKFDMQIMIFQVPIKYYQTSVKSRTEKNIRYKSINDEDVSNRFSFKLYEFKNCEFDINSLSSINTVDSKEPFVLDYSIDVMYNRVYEYNMNEWMQIFFGANNLYWDVERDGANELGTVNYMQDHRYKAIKESMDNIYYYNPTADTFKSLVDASEDMIMYSMRMMDNKYIAGNVNDVVTNAIDTLRNKGNKIRNKVTGFIDSAIYKGRRYLGF